MKCWKDDTFCGETTIKVHMFTFMCSFGNLFVSNKYLNLARIHAEFLTLYLFWMIVRFQQQHSRCRCSTLHKCQHFDCLKILKKFQDLCFVFAYARLLRCRYMKLIVKNLFTAVKMVFFKQKSKYNFRAKIDTKNDVKRRVEKRETV